MFSHFVDAKGNVLGQNNVESSMKVRIPGVSRPVVRWSVILPDVVKLARTYFNCQKAQGVPLED